MFNLKKLREKFSMKVVTDIVPKTKEELEAERDARALADAIERSDEAEKLTYGE